MNTQLTLIKTQAERGIVETRFTSTYVGGAAREMSEMLLTLERSESSSARTD